MFLKHVLSIASEKHSNPGPAIFCKVLYCNIRGLKSNLSELFLISLKYDIILFQDAGFWFRHISELMIANFNKLILLWLDSIPKAQMWFCIHSHSFFGASRRMRFECSCDYMTFVQMGSPFNNYYIFSVNCNSDLNNSIYDGLLVSMAAVQEFDPKSSFILCWGSQCLPLAMVGLNFNY